MNMRTTRRRFVEITPFAGLALLAACSPKVEPPVAPVAITLPASAAAVTEPAPATTTMNRPMVEKGDAQAVALGYVDDATQVDKVKFNSYVSGSQCDNCVLYHGKAGFYPSLSYDVSWRAKVPCRFRLGLWHAMKRRSSGWGRSDSRACRRLHAGSPLSRRTVPANWRETPAASWVEPPVLRLCETSERLTGFERAT